MKGIQQMVSAVLGSAIIIAMTLAEGAISVAMACNYYASPNGGGNGSSPSSPFRISQFWAVARPGSTLCLLDGQYTDDSSMIKPPSGRTAQGPITIKAVNDGRVTIDGQNARTPIDLQRVNGWVIEGMDVKRGLRANVNVYQSNNNIFRRIVSHDAGGVQYILSSGSDNNVFEDVAGFGTGRKIFSPISGSSNNTFRRVWGCFGGHVGTGPRTTMSPIYHNDERNNVIENGIFSWCDNLDTSQSHAILSAGGVFASNPAVHLKILGSIVYLRNGVNFPPTYAVNMQKADEIVIRDLMVHLDSNFASKKTVFLSNCDIASGVPCLSTNLQATNLSLVGGAGNVLTSQWKQSNVREGSLSSIYGSESLWHNGGNKGATFCKRYVNGALTNTGIFDSNGKWPMNDRINRAIVASGRTVASFFGTSGGLTGFLEATFGPIPDACKGSSNSTGSGSSPSAAAPLPSAPTNLQANP